MKYQIGRFSIICAIKKYMDTEEKRVKLKKIPDPQVAWNPGGVNFWGGVLVEMMNNEVQAEPMTAAEAHQRLDLDAIRYVVNNQTIEALEDMPIYVPTDRRR